MYFVVLVPKQHGEDIGEPALFGATQRMVAQNPAFVVSTSLSDGLIFSERPKTQLWPVVGIFRSNSGAENV